MEKKIELKQTGIRVRLIGEDGNAFMVLGKVRAALRRAGYGQEFIKGWQSWVRGFPFRILCSRRYILGMEGPHVVGIG